MPRESCYIGRNGKKADLHDALGCLVPAGPYPVGEVVYESFTCDHRNFCGHLINDWDLPSGVEFGASFLYLGCIDVRKTRQALRLAGFFIVRSLRSVRGVDEPCSRRDRDACTLQYGQTYTTPAHAPAIATSLVWISF